MMEPEWDYFQENGITIITYEQVYIYTYVIHIILINTILKF